MKIKLRPNLAERVLALMKEHGYAPDEIGIALVTVPLKEKRLGN